MQTIFAPGQREDKSGDYPCSGAREATIVCSGNHTWWDTNTNHVRGREREQRKEHKQAVYLIIESIEQHSLNRKKPLKSPVGPPFSPPLVSIWNVLSLTPPITTSSSAPQAQSRKLLSVKFKLENESFNKNEVHLLENMKIDHW